MRDVVERTGVGEATLRAWETRYGFPAPKRLKSGHRRYDELDVEIVREAMRLRDAGLPVPLAIERARRVAERPPVSIFAGLRRERPELPVHRLPKRSLIAISHAIEDESAYGSADLLLFGAFQRERHYRASEARWRELSRAADAAFVFADFPEPRQPAGGPVEVPIGPRDPLVREWAVVSDSRDRPACMVGWEPPGQDVPDAERRFDVLWTADRRTVRLAAQIAIGLAAEEQLVAAMAERLAEPVPASPDDLRRAESLTARIVAYLAAP
jgi:DICT domain-containing protein